ncbi:unnamed protein product [Spirodela intermedia]|uniref:Uncharacterized protein n=1 Tax=Spirodela intermedia TaxID=51605 RepID=A0A7I8IIF1_SPIIN|nr:unnamed protein product [Spirodela intermedia]CAA6657270.1 unnamed protein product [Spirodela intermedia]
MEDIPREDDSFTFRLPLRWSGVASRETGSPPRVRIRVDGRSFELHKSPLILKCGYFKKLLLGGGCLEVCLPEDFPGGSETFERISLFVYGYLAPFDPSTVAAVRCAAEFLEMTENVATCNLLERSDLYLNQVVLQSWKSTLVVLHNCLSLLKFSEDLLIVTRCVESLAFMACMEVLDPEQRSDWPDAALRALAWGPWSSSSAVEGTAGETLWVKDLVALPFQLFKRIVGSLRRQGMEEKYVIPIVIIYANRWLVPEKTHDDDQASSILEGVVDLLVPVGAKANTVVPVRFFFSLLSRALRHGLGEDSRRRLESQIVSLLPSSQVGDLLLPDDREGPISSSREVEAMETIFSTYVTGRPSERDPVVADLWDCYLVDVIPLQDRETHDNLYRALDAFLLHFRRNEGVGLQVSRLPEVNGRGLRSGSPKRADAAAADLPSSLRSAAEHPPGPQGQSEFSGNLVLSSGRLRPQDQRTAEKLEITRAEYQSTSFRIQTLESELYALRRNLQMKGESMAEDKMGWNCVGSFTWGASQRKQADQLLKMLRGSPCGDGGGGDQRGEMLLQRTAPCPPGMIAWKLIGDSTYR